MVIKVGIFDPELSAPTAQVIRGAFAPENVEFCVLKTQNFMNCYAEWHNFGVRIVYLPKGLVPEKAFFQSGMRFITHFSGNILELEEPPLMQSFKKFNKSQ